MSECPAAIFLPFETDGPCAAPAPCHLPAQHEGPHAAVSPALCLGNRWQIRPAYPVPVNSEIRWFA